MGIELELYHKESVPRYRYTYQKSEYFDLCQFLELWAGLIFAQPDLKHREDALIFFDIATGYNEKIRVVWTSNEAVIKMEDKIMDQNFSYEHNYSWKVKLTEYSLSVGSVCACCHEVTVTCCRICKVYDKTFTHASGSRVVSPCKNALRIAKSRSDRFFTTEVES